MPRGIYKRTPEMQTGKNQWGRLKTSGSFKKGHKDVTTDEGRKKQSEKTKGENHYNWSGGVPRYFHQYIEKIRGKARKYICEICKNRQALDWANINHKYDEDPENYMALCRSCHSKYDFKYNNKNKIKQRISYDS